MAVGDLEWDSSDISHFIFHIEKSHMRVVVVSVNPMFGHTLIDKKYNSISHFALLSRFCDESPVE